MKKFGILVILAAIQSLFLAVIISVVGIFTGMKLDSKNKNKK